METGIWGMEYGEWNTANGIMEYGEWNMENGIMEDKK